MYMYNMYMYMYMYNMYNMYMYMYLYRRSAQQPTSNNLYNPVSMIFIEQLERWILIR